jgi:5-formyltetrahydrofolate cyclo-ligase
METKEQIRKMFINNRKNIHIPSDYFVSQITTLACFQQAKVVALYYPLPGEANLLSLLVNSTKKYCFPKVIGNNLKFFEVHSLSDFSEGSFHVQEPTTTKEITKDTIDLMIIPCVGINHHLQRIGYGKGYYDRFCENYRGLKITCVPSFFQTKNELNEWDLTLDYVITEKSILQKEKTLCLNY